MRASSVRGSEPQHHDGCLCIGTQIKVRWRCARGDGPKVNEICERLLMAQLSRFANVRNLLHTAY
jgi:hypothetical protein